MHRKSLGLVAAIAGPRPSFTGPDLFIGCWFRAAGIRRYF